MALIAVIVHGQQYSTMMNIGTSGLRVEDHYMVGEPGLLCAPANTAMASPGQRPEQHPD